MSIFCWNHWIFAGQKTVAVFNFAGWNTHWLANSRETFLKTFFLHKRTFDTVHDDVHDLKEDRRRQRTRWEDHPMLRAAAAALEYGYRYLQLLPQLIGPRHLQAFFLSGYRWPAGSRSLLWPEWWCECSAVTESWPEPHCIDGPGGGASISLMQHFNTNHLKKSGIMQRSAVRTMRVGGSPLWRWWWWRQVDEP